MSDAGLGERGARRRWPFAITVAITVASAGSGRDDPPRGGSAGASGLDDDAVAETDAATDGGGGDEGPSPDLGPYDTAGPDSGPIPPQVGSCRGSELYGAAGGYPAFDDPAYAPFLDRQVLVMTSYGVTPDEPELRVIDISGDAPPPNTNYAAPIYIHPSWTSSAFGGGIFGLTLDSDGNIYVAASRVYGKTNTPGRIYRIDAATGEIGTFADLPNAGPAFGNLNYDCVTETIYVSNHEDGRIYQLDLSGSVVSTFHHASRDVTIGLPSDPGEPDGAFCPLGERVWAVQSHYGRLYYSVWWEDSGRKDPDHENEIWSVEYDEDGVPDPTTAKLEATIPGLQGNDYSNPVSDISFAATGWMLVSERTMTADAQTFAHQSTTYELQQMGGTWSNVGTTYVVGELPNSAAGGVDHDFEDGGYVWMTGDALDFYSPSLVYGVQGTPYGGGTIENSTLIDHDGEVTGLDKTLLGDCEIPIPGDAVPPPPPPEG